VAPQRIASLISSGTEILYGIGAGERVIAVSHECDYPSDVDTKPRVTYANIDGSLASGAIDERVKELIRQGKPLYGIDRIFLERLSPDLIVTQAQCDVCAVRYQDVVDMVQECETFHGTQIVSLNPQSLDDILDDVQRVGEAVGAGRAARDYADSLRQRIEHVRKAVATARLRRVACIEWVEPLMLVGNWMPELIRIAGGDDRLSRPGHSTYSSWNDVRQYDPEVIVVMPCGFDILRSLSEVPKLSKLAGWWELTAVRAGRVYAVDGNAYFNRSGPRIVDSLEMLAHFLHGDLVPPPLAREKRPHAWQRLAG
jgi:iron complex transport system substrate-binding protein